MLRFTSRLLAALELLQVHRRLTGGELAARLGVDRRTVRRYITQLEEMGIPITTERGCDGAYLLVAGFKLPPMMFTDDEAVILSVGLVAAEGLGLRETTATVASARAKLERVMPAPSKNRLRDIAASIALDLPDSGGPLDPRLLATLSAATHAQRRVCLRYRTGPGTLSARDCDPYGMAYRAGRWYLVGYCHLRRDLRTFRLDRIADAHLENATFAPPPNFDAQAHLSRALAAMPGKYTVEVEWATDVATALREAGRLNCVVAPQGNGVVLRWTADDLDWCARELARLPGDVTILRPAALRGALRRVAERLIRVSATVHTASRRGGARAHTSRQRTSS